jgi:hypothetical protein
MAEHNSPLSMDELRKSLATVDGGSQIIEERVITLKTNPSKHTLSWSLEDISRAFKELYMHSYVKLGNKEKQNALDTKADMFRTEVLQNLKNVKSGLVALTTKWEQELVELEHNINSNYSNSVEVTLNPATPQEHDFITIIENLDYFIIIQDNLWMAKGESIAAKNRTQQSVNKRISALVTSARTKSRIIRNLRLELKDDKASTKTDSAEA